MSRQGKIALIVIGIIVLITGIVLLGFYRGLKLSAEQTGLSFGTLQAKEIAGVQATVPNKIYEDQNSYKVNSKSYVLLGFDLPTNLSNLNQVSLLVNVGKIANAQTKQVNSLELDEVTSGWDEQNVAYNSLPTTAANPETAASLDEIIASKASNGWVSFNLKPLIDKWQKDPATNFGMLIKVSNSPLSCFINAGENSSPMIQWASGSASKTGDQEVAQNQNVLVSPTPLATATATTPGQITLGDNGPEVEKIQTELQKSGLLSEKEINGKYNLTTYLAVREAQKNDNLPVTGKIDANTEKAILGQPHLEQIPIVAYRTIISSFLSSNYRQNFWLNAFVPGVAAIAEYGYSLPVLDLASIQAN